MVDAWYKSAPERFGDNSGYFDREREANRQAFDWYSEEPLDDGYPEDGLDNTSQPDIVHT